MLRERAASTTELAAVLETPKGTVGHHLKVLESAGLVRVVRTRKVRALTEKYYGRVARLFVLKSDESLPDDLRGGAISALMLRRAADDLVASGDEQETAGLVNIRLTNANRVRFEKRLNQLVADYQARRRVRRASATSSPTRCTARQPGLPPAEGRCVASGRPAASGVTATS